MADVFARGSVVIMPGVTYIYFKLLSMFFFDVVGIFNGRFAKQTAPVSLGMITFKNHSQAKNNLHLNVVDTSQYFHVIIVVSQSFHPHTNKHL